MSELKPCPFCGSTDVGGSNGIISCYGCKIETVRRNTRDTVHAMEAWNNRAAPEVECNVSVDDGAWSNAALVVNAIANGGAAKLALSHYGFKTDEQWAKALVAEIEELLHLNSVQADNLRKERAAFLAAEKEKGR